MVTPAFLNKAKQYSQDLIKNGVGEDETKQIVDNMLQKKLLKNSKKAVLLTIQEAKNKQNKK